MSGDVSTTSNHSQAVHRKRDGRVASMQPPSPSPRIGERDRQPVFRTAPLSDAGLIARRFVYRPTGIAMTRRWIAYRHGYRRYESIFSTVTISSESKSPVSRHYSARFIEFRWPATETPILLSQSCLPRFEFFHFSRRFAILLVYGEISNWRFLTGSLAEC